MALTAQQELFCQKLIELKFNATDAYSAAYPKSSKAAARAHGARLVAKGSIAARIAELTEAAAKPAAVTAEWALRRLLIEAEFTGPGSSHSARVAAIALALKHLGLLKEDAPHPDRPKFDLSRLSTEQRRAIAFGLRLAIAG